MSSAEGDLSLSGADRLVLRRALELVLDSPSTGSHSSNTTSTSNRRGSSVDIAASPRRAAAALLPSLGSSSSGTGASK